MCFVQYNLNDIVMCTSLFSLQFIVIGMTLGFLYTLQYVHGNCILRYFQICALNYRS